MQQKPPITEENVCLTDVENKKYCFKSTEIEKLSPKSKGERVKQVIVIAIKPQTFLPFLLALAILGYVQYGDLNLMARFLGSSILMYLLFILFSFTGIVTLWFALDFYISILTYTGLTESILATIVFYSAVGFGLLIHVALLSLLLVSANDNYGYYGHGHGHRHRMEEAEDWE